MAWSSNGLGLLIFSQDNVGSNPIRASILQFKGFLDSVPETLDDAGSPARGFTIGVR